MKNAIIIHGMPGEKEYYQDNIDSPSNSHRLPWLQKQLLCENILTQTPEMPHPYKPNYKDWKDVLESYTINQNTILIGHSCGAWFILRYLSENNIKVGIVILVAPYISPENLDIAKNMFSWRTLKKDIYRQTQSIIIFSSDNDMQEIQDSVDIILQETEQINIKIFHNYGHFCLKDMQTREFPELKEYITKNL